MLVSLKCLFHKVLTLQALLVPRDSVFVCRESGWELYFVIYNAPRCDPVHSSVYVTYCHCLPARR